MQREDSKGKPAKKLKAKKHPQRNESPPNPTAPLHLVRGGAFSSKEFCVVLTRSSEILQPPHIFAGLLYRGYRAIAIDAPTHFKCRTALQVANWNSRRDVEKHYATLSFEETATLPLRDLAHPDGCHLFEWTSGPHLPCACELIKRWGFKYSSKAFTWVKLRRGLNADQFHLLTESDLHVGLGLTTRKGTEDVLLGRRGNCRRIAKDVREIILAPVREHSRKPDEFYARVERYCDGPFVDLFARERRPNWDVWGDQTKMFSKEVRRD
jgi:N6-adenosine-specific RNA methylase IME4